MRQTLGAARRRAGDGAGPYDQEAASSGLVGGEPTAGGEWKGDHGVTRATTASASL